MDADYLVIGGGSAGCVVASRLSEDPRFRVILVEGGKDDAPEEVRTGKFLTYNRPPYYWDMADERGPYNQPRILGGGSALNAMHAQRGSPDDYDEWRQLGVKGWGYDDVRPYFERVERDSLYPSSHGKVAISRIPDRSWSGLSKALSEALPKYGLARLNDINREQGDGFGAVPLSYENGERVSSASAYLGRDVRARANLRILSEHEARSLILEGNKVVGARIEGGDGPAEVRAGETILCCGGILTPALMLRSGIGPAEELLRHGVAAKVDRPGVGKNLQNHPMLFVGTYLKPSGRQPAEAVHPCPYLIRYSSRCPSCPPTDMLINIWERIPGRLAWDPTGRQIAILNVIVNKVYSRGQVTLDPRDPKGPPAVRFNFLSDERDLKRMVESVHFLQQLLTDPAVRLRIGMAFAPVWKPLAITMMGHGAKAQLFSMAGAVALSGPRWLRRRLLADMGVELGDLDRRSEAEIADFVKTYMLPSYHVSGTCRMGDPRQKETVVDSAGAAIGVDGLRIVDASIFPTLMAAGLNLPVMMAAEKISDAAIAARRDRAAA